MSDIIKQLFEIGFTEYEARTYSVLLQHNLLSAGEISKLSNVPQGRVYNIIEKLVQKGFCTTVPGAVKKFKAGNPKIAIKELIEDKKRELINSELKFNSIGENLETIFNNAEDKSSPLDYIQTLTSKSAQLDKFHEIIDSTEIMSRGFNKPPYAVLRDYQDPLKSTKPVIDKIKKGMKIKGIWEIEENNVENFLMWVTHFEENGEEVRICSSLPLKMIIADERIVMFTLHNKGVVNNKLTSMVVEHSDLTNALIDLFEFYWEQSLTLDEFLKSRNLKRPTMFK